MALYMVEKRRVWHRFRSHNECWMEFASRLQVRTLLDCNYYYSIFNDLFIGATLVLGTMSLDSMLTVSCCLLSLHIVGVLIMPLPDRNQGGLP